MRKLAVGLVLLGSVFAPASTAFADTTIHQSGTVGRDGCRVRFDTGRYIVTSEFEFVFVEGPSADGEFDECV